MQRNKCFLLCGFLIILSVSRHIARANAPVTESFVFLTTWGNDIGQQGEKTALAVFENRIYVADELSFGINAYDLSGRPLFHFGGPGQGPGQFYPVYGIAVDSLGFIYATDFVNERVQKFTSDGQYLTEWGTSGFGHSTLSLPMGIAVYDTE